MSLSTVHWSNGNGNGILLRITNQINRVYWTVERELGIYSKVTFWLLYPTTTSFLKYIYQFELSSYETIEINWRRKIRHKRANEDYNLIDFVFFQQESPSNYHNSVITYTMPFFPLLMPIKSIPFQYNSKQHL